jgi:hypothetical protein
VVRFDLRDSGGSTTADPHAAAYTLRDLAADATGPLCGTVVKLDRRDAAVTTALR